MLHVGTGLGLTCKLVVSREISMQRLRHWTAQSEFRASNLFHVFGLQNNESCVVHFRGSSDGRSYQNSIVLFYRENNQNFSLVYKLATRCHCIFFTFQSCQCFLKRAPLGFTGKYNNSRFLFDCPLI